MHSLVVRSYKAATLHATLRHMTYFLICYGFSTTALNHLIRVTSE